MWSFIFRFLAIGAIISLTACTSVPKPTENYLDAGARQHIKTVDAVLIAKQDRIGADIKQNRTLSQIGAIASTVSVFPVLMDVGVASVRTINANKLAKPVREKLEDHDYPFEFKKQVEQSLKGTSLAGIDDFKIVRSEFPGMRGLLVAESDADAVLLVDMKYSFTPNFGTLYVHSLAMLFPNRPELKQFQESAGNSNLIEFSDNIYRNQYAVGISTNSKNGTAEENAKIWAKMTEEQLTEVLDVAALTMSDTIARDIGIDDVESDLNLLPEGYVLNTKYDNFNEKYARIKSLDTIFETTPNQSDPDDTIDAGKELDRDDTPEEAPGLDPEVEAEIEASVGSDVKTGS